MICTNCKYNLAENGHNLCFDCLSNGVVELERPIAKNLLKKRFPMSEDMYRDDLSEGVRRGYVKGRRLA